MCRIITKTGINVKGKVLVPCEYDEIIPAMVDGAESNELFLTMKNGEMEVIKINEKDSSYKKSSYRYHNVYSFDSNGIAIVSRKEANGKYKHGLINTELYSLLTCNSDAISHISGSLYAVFDAGKYGIYDAEKRRFTVTIEFSGIDYDEEEQKIMLKL